MTVYLVGAGPGDPGLITRRGSELIRRADVVVHDRLVARELLELAPHGAELIDVGKRPGDVERQAEINALLVDRGSAGKLVVRLKGGDPFLFGRGGEEAAALDAAGVEFEVVPGVPSAFAVPAYAGIPVTHRGLATSVTVVTGHASGEPDDPGAVDWASLARAGGTLVILMGLATKAEIAKRLIEGGRDPRTPVIVVEHGTTTKQRSVRTSLEQLSDVEVDAPSTIVVGKVAGLALDWFERRPLHGTSVVVTRAVDQAGELSVLLDVAGANVIGLPVIEFDVPSDGGEGLARAAEHVSDYEWIVFTSTNAVNAFLAELHDARSLASNRVAAVGTSTADSLLRFGIRADLVPEESSAEDLARAMPDREPRTGSPASSNAGRVLFPRSNIARPALASALRKKGWTVEEVEAYRTVTADPGPGTDALVERASRADVVTFASPSAVEGFMKLVGNRRVPPTVVCIGPVTAVAAEQQGLQVSVVADRREASGIVSALTAHLSGQR
ncbi:MAG TPA: uroporphyrinogen-III C-methyltransferase [Acidimicrobiales bacterium]|nr:uroporphyrinogen-III C-methyltransferase [Acidimicrobiales bacterium]